MEPHSKAFEKPVHEGGRRQPRTQDHADKIFDKDKWPILMAAVLASSKAAEVPSDTRGTGVIINGVNLVPNIIYGLSSFSWLKVHDVVWILMACQILM